MTFQIPVGFPWVPDSFTNITPLTYRDASTLLDEQDQLKEWLSRVVIPNVNTEIARLITEYAESTVKLAELVELYNSGVGNVAGSIAVIQAIKNDAVSETAALAGEAKASKDGSESALALAVAARDAAQVAQAAAEQVGQTSDTQFLRRLVEGTKVNVYGDSFAEVPASYVAAGQEWPNLLATEWAMLQASKAISGARMVEAAILAIGTTLAGTALGDRHFVPGTTGPVVVLGVTNDALLGPATQGGVDAFEHALRTLLAATTAARRIEASEATASGVWTVFPDLNTSAGSMQYNTTVGDKLTFSNITAPAGKIYVGSIASRADNPTGVIAAFVDGVQVTTFTGNGQSSDFVSAVSGAVSPAGYTPAVFAVPVPSVGSHTVELRHASGATVYVDAIYIPPAAPAPVIVCKPPAVSSLASVQLQAAWAGNSPALFARMATVVAEFSSASILDLNVGWVPATMVAGTDASKIHPNAAGMEFIRSKISAALIPALKKWYTAKVWKA